MFRKLGLVPVLALAIVAVSFHEASARFRNRGCRTTVSQMPSTCGPAQTMNGSDGSAQAADPVTPEEQGWFDKMYAAVKGDPSVELERACGRLEEVHA